MQMVESASASIQARRGDTAESFKREQGSDVTRAGIGTRNEREPPADEPTRGEASRVGPAEYRRQNIIGSLYRNFAEVWRSYSKPTVTAAELGKYY